MRSGIGAALGGVKGKGRRRKVYRRLGIADGQRAFLHLRREIETVCEGEKKLGRIDEGTVNRDCLIRRSRRNVEKETAGQSAAGGNVTLEEHDGADLDLLVGIVDRNRFDIQIIHSAAHK